jgi:hypothetical protein
MPLPSIARVILTAASLTAPLGCAHDGVQRAAASLPPHAAVASASHRVPSHRDPTNRARRRYAPPNGARGIASGAIPTTLRDPRGALTGFGHVRRGMFERRRASRGTRQAAGHDGPHLLRRPFWAIAPPPILPSCPGCAPAVSKFVPSTRRRPGSRSPVSSWARDSIGADLEASKRRFRNSTAGT